MRESEGGGGEGGQRDRETDRENQTEENTERERERERERESGRERERGREREIGGGGGGGQRAGGNPLERQVSLDPGQMPSAIVVARDDLWRRSSPERSTVGEAWDMRSYRDFSC